MSDVTTSRRIGSPLGSVWLVVGSRGDAVATADLARLRIDDLDLPFLEKAFEGRVAAEFVCWDDASVDWAPVRPRGAAQHLGLLLPAHRVRCAAAGRRGEHPAAQSGSFLGGAYAEVVEAVQPSVAMLAVAEQAVARYRELAVVDPALVGTEPLLYSRVDLIETDDGEPCCLEMELIEPSLFFETDAKAATRFVDAVLARLWPRRRPQAQ